MILAAWESDACPVPRAHQDRAVYRKVLLGVLMSVVTIVLAAPASAEALSGREARCLAMIAYAEAAVDGIPGMTAVMRVVRNRMADPRFPNDACAVIAQAGQFQPLTESPVLRQVARDPEGYSVPHVLGARSPQARLLLATAHRLARMPLSSRDPTGSALYFVNPKLMDPARCPWFAELKRTAQIGSHVFLTDYQPGENRGAPALDCGQAGSRRVVIMGDLAR
jgi:spore germination cell wall hydrolase CwlJ-like protein